MHTWKPERRRLPAIALAATLAVPLAGLPAAPAAALPPAVTPTSPAAGAEPVIVTLITGDVVRYDAAARTVDVVTSVSNFFRGEQTKTGVYLIPEAAQPLVASGTLDRELFNVEYLATNGYGDGQRSELPVIVDYAGTGPAVAAKASGGVSALAAAKPVRVLESLGAVGARVDKKDTAAFWKSLAPGDPTTGSSAARTLAAGIERVWLDRKVAVTLDESVPQIGAPQAWAAGLDGTGVTVAVLDSGIDVTHPDLTGKVVVSQDFTGAGSVSDGHGHGTHVASTVAGTGAASSGRYKGVAPGANLAIGKVLDNQGNGDFSWVIDGMEWATQQAGADIVSMSLGTPSASDGTDLVSLAVDSLTASTGALFVIAAGNAGPSAGTVGAPGAAASALTVGAVDKSDALAGFSSTGPLPNTFRLKPDITAPGVAIAAARAAGTSMGTPLDDRYTAANGTSMATPHVAGSVAILKQQHPQWTPAQLKAALTGTAKDSGQSLSSWKQGAGRVDVARATSQALRTDTAGISPGALEPDQPAHTTQVRFHNDGTTELAVTLRPELRGEDGNPAPSGALTVDAQTVTVPAGGSATATVTVDHAKTDFGNFQGVLSASTVAGDTLRIPVGFRASPDTSKLTVRVILPMHHSDVRFLFAYGPSALRVDDRELPWHTGGTLAPTADPDVLQAEMRVPDGIHTVYGAMDWGRWSSQQRHVGNFLEPEVTVRGDTIVTIDMRKMVPVSVSADKPTEKVWRARKMARTTVAGNFTNSFQINNLPTAYQEWVSPSAPVTLGTYTNREGFILAEPEAQLHLKTRHGGLTLQPSYLDQSLPRLPADRETVLITEAELRAGANAHGALVHVNLPHAAYEPASWERCPDIDQLSIHCAVVNRTREAHSAGAIGVVLTTPLEGLEQLSFVRDLAASTRLPVIWLDNPQAAKLAGVLTAGTTVRVDLDVSTQAAYEYKLWLREVGRIPASMAYRVKSKDLKAIDTEYRTAPSASPNLPNVAEYMHAFWPGDDFSAAFVRHFNGPTRRVEYHTPTGPDAVNWLQIWMTDHATGNRKTGATRRTIVDRAPETLVWGGVTAPGQFRVEGLAPSSQHVCLACRQGNLLYLNPRPGMGAGAVGWISSSQHAVAAKLYRDGVLVPGTGLYTVPAGAARYRMEHTLSDLVAGTGYGKKVSTVWDFTGTAALETGDVTHPYVKPLSANPAPAAWQPMIFLGYDAPLNLDDTVAAGTSQWVTVYAASGKPGSGADIAGLTMEVSYDDGATWVAPSRLVAEGNGVYRILLRHPKLSATTGAVTLRTRAWDRAGNTVSQTVERAFGLTAPVKDGNHNIPE